jgi:VanZ family protein
MKIRKPIIFALIFVTILIFIWGNSSKSFEGSRQISEFVTEQVNLLLEPLVGHSISDSIIRKFAHVTEYAVLGGVMISFLTAGKRRNLQAIFNCLFIGLSVAVLDETIQIFSNRGSSVLDVLLDFLGVCIGIILVNLINPKKSKHIHTDD